MATRRDVARLAGTSEALVSYVLNNGPRKVAPATRERILAAIDELGYRPNAVARSLKTSRTMTFGLVVPDNSNPFFAELARVIEDVGFASGYTMLLGNAMGDDAREATYVRTLLDRRVDGLIVVPIHGPHSWVAELSDRTTVPRLVLDRELELPGATQVLTDNEGGAYRATTHLLGHGRERIGCIAGLEGVHPTVDRVAGWRRALVEAGRDPGNAPLTHVPFGRGDGYRAGRRMLAHAGHPDALFVASDEQAIGVLRAAAELGLRVPDDVAVCAFDGIDGSEYTVPALTTMRQPFEELGRSAVEWLLAKIADPALPVQRITHPTTLIARGSCGCPDPVGGESMIGKRL
ncbi:LacI family DNA-binding transcriptional regulator [Streptomyces spongiicola]|uniref:LacI family DNA-binding transcriptional regulator n=1 Tax=Streptomyces spongiicola TaxID=1690221 RepID=A0A388T136_9ACTN|nr:LacI family DNA-binding transcriptional regulator [Streptomyces spongiicola]GBQ02648.1 LacI family DNA-binding transcriptional regulator [Streptomyces spongiicola]